MKTSEEFVIRICMDSEGVQNPAYLSSLIHDCARTLKDFAFFTATELFRIFDSGGNVVGHAYITDSAQDAEKTREDEEERQRELMGYLRC